jgi:putative flippase GtrA
MTLKQLTELNPILRFLLGGGLNTMVTYGIYLVLNIWIVYSIAYTIAYLSGIVFSYIINTQWVFKQKTSLKSAGMYPLVYLIQYLLGISLLHVLVAVLQLPETIAPLIIIVISLPVTYILTKLILSKH